MDFMDRYIKKPEERLWREEDFIRHCFGYQSQVINEGAFSFSLGVFTGPPGVYYACLPQNWAATKCCARDNKFMGGPYQKTWRMETFFGPVELIRHLAALEQRQQECEAEMVALLDNRRMHTGSDESELEKWRGKVYIPDQTEDLSDFGKAIFPSGSITALELVRR